MFSATRYSSTASASSLGMSPAPYGCRLFGRPAVEPWYTQASPSWVAASARRIGLAQVPAPNWSVRGLVPPSEPGLLPSPLLQAAIPATSSAHTLTGRIVRIGEHLMG